MAEIADIELLRDYALRNSEEAFTTLVQRHIRLVYSVALRQLGDTYQAEEVTQAVFIILARKADGFPGGVPLSGWLYQTARLTTANFLRGEMRRRHYEQKAHMQSEIHESQHDAAHQVWLELAPLLDEAMGHLGDKERNALVVRYFEGRTCSEVAVALGSSEAAVQKRISRSLEKLRSFFARRGVKISSAGLAGAISASSVQATPVALAHTVTAMAITKGAAASSSTLTLIKGALKLMAWTKIRTAMVVGACALVATTATFTLSNLMDRSIRERPPDWLVLAGDPNVWHWAKGKIDTHNQFGDSLLLSSKEYGDFTLSVVASASTREASLAIRMTDADHGYLVVFCPAGTPWTKDNAVQFSLVKRVPAPGGGSTEELLATFRGRKTLAAVGPKARIEVTAHGPSIKVRLNGALALEATDDTYLTGRIGLRTFGDPTVPSDATYTKLTIH
jgi:RNA polymerase sigma factor (sigma-70 family)